MVKSEDSLVVEYRKWICVCVFARTHMHVSSVRSHCGVGHLGKPFCCSRRVFLPSHFQAFSFTSICGREADVVMPGANVLSCMSTQHCAISSPRHPAWL